MMIKKPLGDLRRFNRDCMTFGLIAFATIISIPNDLRACACCSFAAQRATYDSSIEDFNALLSQLEFARYANVADSACGLECVKGIKDPVGSYKVEIEATERQIRIQLANSASGTGTLSILMPDSVTSTQLDPTPGSRVGGLGPQLYHEARIETTVTGTGTFGQIGPERFAAAEFILQGSGRSCVGAEHFSHWQLKVSGTGIDFSLYGAVRLRGSSTIQSPTSTSHLNRRFRVVGVSPPDFLTLRGEPPLFVSDVSKIRVVTRIPSNASNVFSDGFWQEVGESRWIKVRYKGHVGWLNASFLSPVD